MKKTRDEKSRDTVPLNSAIKGEYCRARFWITRPDFNFFFVHGVIEF
jgi:hypothetical protein